MFFFKYYSIVIHVLASNNHCSRSRGLLYWVCEIILRQILPPPTFFRIYRFSYFGRFSDRSAHLAVIEYPPNERFHASQTTIFFRSLVMLRNGRELSCLMIPRSRSRSRENTSNCVLCRSGGRKAGSSHVSCFACTRTRL